MKKIYKSPTAKVFAIEAESLIAISLTGGGDGHDNGLGETGYGGGSTSGGIIEADTRRQGSIWDAWTD